ncbi:unnamed protein product [Symbiodinium microadriaticum]|nr:unnamed protein product [Symbiodinium sp. KB8]CAE7865866.1 unnamed protein product [Symbiodinium microadriaticum]
MGSHNPEPSGVTKRTLDDPNSEYNDDKAKRRRESSEDQLVEIKEQVTPVKQNEVLLAQMMTLQDNQDRQQQTLEELGRQQRLLITLCMSLRQEIADMKGTIVEAITSPSGDFIKAVRQATAPVPTKKLPNPVLFPEDQRATEEELRLECRSLPKAMQEVLMMPYRTALGFMRSTKIKLTLNAWKSVRGGIAKACKQLRLADSACKKPLVWSNESNDGPALLRYVWSQSELNKYLPKVLDQRVTSAKPETWRQRIEQLIKNDPNPIPWPWHTDKDTSGDDCFPAET